MRTFHIQWHILNRCNLRCKHCYQEDYSKSIELTLDQLKKIADNLDLSMKKQKSKLNLLLTGGEPLLREDIFELMEYLEKKKNIFQVDIITNATLIKDKINELKRFKKCKTILFSLDGISQKTNDNIRGEGVFNNVLEQIQYIEAKRFKKILMFTLSKQNYEDSFRLLEFAKEHNLDGIIIEKLVPMGQSKDEFSLVITKNMLKRLYDYLITQNGYDTFKSYEYRALKIEFNKIKGIKFWIKNNNFFNKISVRIKVANCIVARDGAAIMPDGSIFPCRRLPVILGNLLNNEFSEIFENSVILKDLINRDKLKGKCKDCESLDCFGCRAMVYAVKKDLYGEDPHCWK